jgi:uncharacterized protein with GYD domain
MGFYVMLTSLTDEGRKTMMNNPGRLLEVNKEVEAMGAKILVQYAMLGPYDFVNILEAPNNEIIARVSAALGARGTLQPVTYSALTVDAFVKELETAKSKR